MSHFDPLRSDAPVIVYIDYKSPYAFVAKDLTYALSEQLGVAFDWRPLTLDIPSYLGSAKLNKVGKVVESTRSASQWSGVKYAYADARRYAAQQGYALRGTEKIWDTRVAHIGMLWAKAQSEETLRRYTDAIYPPFWVRQLDLEDPQTIIQLLQGSGATTEGFEQYANGIGGAEHDQMQQAIFDCGIFGVPTYVHTASQQWFFGRQHLPTIQWLVEAQLGYPPRPAPDVGYPLASGKIEVDS